MWLIVVARATHFEWCCSAQSRRTVPDGDAAERMPRRRVDEREEEVPAQQNQGEQRQPVVQQDRAREAKAVVALAEPEQRAGDGEEQREGGGERRVHLLARVEAALRPRLRAQPVQVVVVEPVELAHGRAQAAPVAEHHDQCERDEPRDRRIDVKVLQQRPPPDQTLRLGR